MRTINLDEFAASNVTGKSTIMKILERYEKEHPNRKITIPYDKWDITLDEKGKRRNMSIGKAAAILEQIDDEKFTTEEKGLAIYKVLSMETTNSITKQEFKNALKWMWNQHFEYVGD